MNPHTGAVYVMASTPTYDPNLIEQPNGYARVLKIRGDCGGASALYNRATQGLFVPGSTFKTITAAAALDTGTFNASSQFDDPGYCTEYGKQVSNAGNPDQGGREVFGRLNFVTAFQHSVNSVFCNIGIKMGAGRSSRTRRSSASTRRRRSRRRGTSARRAASTTARTSSTRRTRTRSTRDGSRSGRSGCS